MNNEPVAWMETYKGEPNNLDWDKSNLNYGSEFHDVVPLYTHPAELTDEEKLQFGMLFMNWNRSLKEPLVKPAYEQYVFEQAIAILRKAQSTCNGFCGEYECKENQSICKRKASEK